ncbi:hypothetical protein FBU31_001848 [Coemansia sp. 'formosensis']|nr:hypothetical protein FBU31_001848 [Coemansia sp. 'formosensis']
MANNKMPRMCDPRVTRSIANSVLIPVVAKITIGHEIEAEVAVSTGANFIDEFEFASATTCYIEDKKYLPVPVICGVVTLVDCIRRLKEGASILRTRQTMAVRADATLIAINKIADELAALQVTLKDEAKKVTWLTTNSLEAADVEFLKDAKDISVLPLYAYGGISTPRDVALMMEMKCTGVFVDNSIFTSDIPRKRLGAMVKAVECFDNMDEMIKLSTGTAERY